MIAPVDAAVAIAAMNAKGFIETRTGRKDRMFHLHVNGVKTNFWVKVSHGAKEIRRDEIRNNVRPFGIPGDALYKILCCEYDRAETLEVWQNRNR